MFDWLSKLLGWRSAVEERRDNPLLARAAKTSAEIHRRTPLGNLIERDRNEQMARDLYLEINAICSAANPVAVGREKLAVAMLRFAMFQVLLIRPAPLEDPSGLRALPGISGELGAHLAALARHNISLRAALHESEQYSDDADLLMLVEIEYWKTYWLLGTLDAVRSELGDVNERRDWYRPFMHAACANQENLYRIDLDLPPAFEEEIARHAPAAYSIFTDIVVSGASDPLLEWLEYHEDQAVPVPGEPQRVKITSALQA